MMRLHVVRNGRKTGHRYECTHYEYEVVDEDSPIAKGLRNDDGTVTKLPLGITFRLGPPTRQVIHLPTDGDVVYVENEKGDTTNTYRWPLKPETKEFRATAEKG